MCIVGESLLDTGWPGERVWVHRDCYYSRDCVGTKQLLFSALWSGGRVEFLKASSLGIMSIWKDDRLCKVAIIELITIGDERVIYWTPPTSQLTKGPTVNLFSSCCLMEFANDTLAALKEDPRRAPLERHQEALRAQRRARWLRLPGMSHPRHAACHYLPQGDWPRRWPDVGVSWPDLGGGGPHRLVLSLVSSARRRRHPRSDELLEDDQGYRA